MADVGGVGGPVSGGDLLPLDGDLDMDAQRLGQYGGGNLRGQGEQGGAAALPGADPECMEPQAERIWGQRRSWLAAREQPGRGDLEQAAAWSPAPGCEPGDEVVERGATANRMKQNKKRAGNRLRSGRFGLRRSPVFKTPVAGYSVRPLPMG